MADKNKKKSSQQLTISANRLFSSNCRLCFGYLQPCFAVEYSVRGRRFRRATVENPAQRIIIASVKFERRKVRRTDRAACSAGAR
jgi:hypothetical protein